MRRIGFTLPVTCRHLDLRVAEFSLLEKRPGPNPTSAPWYGHNERHESIFQRPHSFDLISLDIITRSLESSPIRCLYTLQSSPVNLRRCRSKSKRATAWSSSGIPSSNM